MNEYEVRTYKGYIHYYGSKVRAMEKLIEGIKMRNKLFKEYQDDCFVSFVLGEPIDSKYQDPRLRSKEYIEQVLKELADEDHLKSTGTEVKVNVFFRSYCLLYRPTLSYNNY